jgi:uncharacterized repeat protein (TIGR04052 family)
MTSLRTLVLLVLVWAVAACATPTPPTTDTNTDTAPPASGEAQPITLRFAAQVNGSPAACESAFQNVGLAESTISFSDFRFYVSDVRLVNGQGEEVPVTLNQDGLWQYENTTLLDFENATGACGEAGTEAMNDQIVGTVPAGEYNEVVFTLGVPFEQNHLDTTMAPSPLNVSALWWNWQVGYKFARVDLLVEGTEPPGYNIHLGSTGCVSDSSVQAPTTDCANPNRVEVRLSGFDHATNTIVADAGALLQRADLSQNAPEPPGCMSMTMDSDCPAVFTGLGLDLKEGVCFGGSCGIQTFFRVE